MTSRSIAIGASMMACFTACSTSGEVSRLLLPIAPVASVELNLPQVGPLPPGGRAQLSATLRDVSGRALSNRKITWSSLNSSVATVSAEGLVTAVGSGTTVVTAGAENRLAAASVIVKPSVAKVVVSPTTVTLAPGVSSQLTATVQDGSGSALVGRTVTWTSSNPSAVSVSQNGSITAIAQGQSIVTASTEGISGTSSVTVSAAPVAAVRVIVQNPTMIVGTTQQISFVSTDASGNVLIGRAAAWKTSNTSTATINGAGLLTALAIGDVSVTANVENASASDLVSIRAIPAASVTVSLQSSSPLVGSSQQATVTVRDAANNVLVGRAVTWSSSNASVASVTATGTINALSPGGAVISAIVEGVSGAAAVNVQAAPVATVSIVPGSANMFAGDTLRAVAVARDQNGAVLTGRSVSWSSSNFAVATVNAAGVITAVGTGAVAISATSEGKSGSTNIVVAANSIVSVVSGGPYACALRSGGQLYCWGALPTGEVLPTPQRVAASNQWSAVSAGYSAICAISTAKVGYCWGGNPFGGLGNGTAPGPAVFVNPQEITGSRSWSEIQSSIYATCGSALPDNAVYCWGGVGTAGAERTPALQSSTTPALINGSLPLSTLTVGSSQACGRNGSASWYCFGDTGAGFLNAPTRISNPGNISGTYAIGMQRTCSITSLGGAYCFGANAFGEIANGSTAFSSISPDAPVLVGPSINWAKMFSGRTLHYCGVDIQARGYCWGMNTSGQVGDGTTIQRAIPTLLSGGWIQLAPGLGSGGWGNRDHTCGLSVDGNVYCWGSGESGQLGNGTRQSSLTPVRVTMPN